MPTSIEKRATHLMQTTGIVVQEKPDRTLVVNMKGSS
jgi:ribosomal protein S17